MPYKAINDLQFPDMTCYLAQCDIEQIYNMFMYIGIQISSVDKQKMASSSNSIV
jgi:hypothetical protein